MTDPSPQDYWTEFVAFTGIPVADQITILRNYILDDMGCGEDLVTLPNNPESLLDFIVEHDESDGLAYLAEDCSQDFHEGNLDYYVQELREQEA